MPLRLLFLSLFTRLLPPLLSRYWLGFKKNPVEVFWHISSRRFRNPAAAFVFVPTPLFLPRSRARVGGSEALTLQGLGADPPGIASNIGEPLDLRNSLAANASRPGDAPLQITELDLPH